MSDYFDVSLDYLMRGIKKENNEEKSTFIYFVVGIGFDGGTGF